MRLVRLVNIDMTCNLLLHMYFVSVSNTISLFLRYLILYEGDIYPGMDSIYIYCSNVQLLDISQSHVQIQ